jgi:hypothetical protein
MLKGLSSAAIVVPTLCELINIMYRLGINDDYVNDISSSIWNFGNYLGESFGPLIGGIVTNRYSFPISCNVVSIINLIYGIIYTIFARKLIKDEINNDNHSHSTKRKISLTFYNSPDVSKSVLSKDLKYILKDETKKLDSDYNYEYKKL